MRRLFARFALLCLAPAAVAEPVTRPGFSFDAPRGWIAVTPDRREMMEHAPTSVRQVLARIDLRQVEAFVVDPAEDEFHESVNVVTQPGEMPVTEYSRADLARTLPEHYENSGVSVQSMRVEIATLGKNRVLLAISDLRLSGTEVDLRQWQVFVPGRGRTYTLTCTARKQDFAEREPIFQSVLESLTVEAPAGQGGILGGAARGALFGGAAGAVAALAFALWRWKKRTGDPVANPPGR